MKLEDVKIGMRVKTYYGAPGTIVAIDKIQCCVDDNRGSRGLLPWFHPSEIEPVLTQGDIVEATIAAFSKNQ